MAATIKGLAGTVFGVTTVTGVVMQTLKSKLETKLAEMADEDGDTVAFGFYGGGRSSIDGRYGLKGPVSTLASHISSGVVASAIAGVTPFGGGSLYLMSFDSEENHDNFAYGNFAAVAQSGITG